MPKKQQQPQQQQVAPGALLYTPTNPVQPRLIEEVGPCALGTSVTLQQGTQVSSAFQKFQTLDVVRGYLLELDYATTFNSTGATPTITESTLSPWVAIQNISVQFESAYVTYHATGPLAGAWQQFRPMFGPRMYPPIGWGSGVGGVPAAASGDKPYAPYTTTPPLATPNFAIATNNTQQTWRQFVEIPVTSPPFDVYWDLSVNGQIQSAPFHRAYVSPQYMAATNRNVTPQVTWNPLIATTNAAGALTYVPAGGTSTASGSVACSWFRDAWLPPAGGGQAYAPPVYGWQYSRDYLAVPFQGTNGAFPITLDSTVTGQGQLLSIVGYCWDPTLNGGNGGITPIGNYATLELIYGSTVQLRQQTPTANLYEWGSLHGQLLPAGFFGWDLALTRDGKYTNENCINTLIQAGSQVRLTWNSGSAPSNGSVIYIGIESLKKVGS